MTHHSRVMLKFPSKVGPRASKNGGITSILTMDLNTRTWKTSTTAVSSKSTEFVKLTRKNSLKWGNFAQCQNFHPCSASLCEIRREIRWRRRGPCITHRSRVMPKFQSKMEPWPSRNGVISIFTTDSNSATWKSYTTVIPCKSIEFDKLTQKTARTIMRAF